MILKTLSGKEFRLQYKKHSGKPFPEDQARSKIQFWCGQELVQFFPRHFIIEEFVIPEINLRLDFFIPDFMLAIEVQGEQHSNYNSFFYNAPADFYKAKVRDKKKKEWCDLNGIKLIEVKKGDDVRKKVYDGISNH